MTEHYHPYLDLPDHCYWNRTHKGKKVSEIDPVVVGKFQITPQMKIATAGSCFAQHIARRLKSSGYNYFVTEAAHPIIDATVANTFNYGTFSARYGNIYTVRQLHQLALRAFGHFKPVEDVWENNGRYYDPFRPNIQPDGFASLDEYWRDQFKHLSAVRKLLTESDVFVFTLGLTESWRSKKDGAVFPLCPGTAAGTFKPEEHEFVNFSVSETVEDFKAFVNFVRVFNEKLKIIITVSPVPLIATANRDQSVITATSYSKSVLRVACDELERSLEQVYYFPSYEIITGNFNRGAYFGRDFRQVEESGVNHVMSLFLKYYTSEHVLEETHAQSDENKMSEIEKYSASLEKELDIICDEEILDRK